MPIVDIEIVLRPNELGEIFHSSPRKTWVKVQLLTAEQYAENRGRPGVVYPIFVTVMKSELPSFEEMQDQVAKITGAVAQICGHPSENIHVIYQPEGKGRAAFGGAIVS
jgi:hypothetical protein